MTQELKDLYDSLDSKWQYDIERFVQLIILDGCFMLKILYLTGTDYTSYSNYYPILNQYGRVNFMIKADMLMLENQLPILILISLKCFLKHKDEGFVLALSLMLFVRPNIEELKDLTKRTLCLISNFDPFIENFDGIINDLETTACLHVLDLCRKSLLPTHSEHGNASPQFSNQGKGRSNRVSHNVAHLVSTFHDAGIGFMRSKSKSLRNITFDCGILKIPNFIVSDYTETMVLNLLAFESCHLSVRHEITSFVVFMGCIIDDAWDIKLLSSKAIIDNFIGPGKKVADLFNTMSKDLVMGKDLYKVYTDLIDYCNKPWPKWRANLIQTYFRSPWTIVSIIAATFGLSLATVQTIFTILN